MEETEEIKEWQKQLEKANADQEKRLEFAHECIKILTVQVDAQAKMISGAGDRCEQLDKKCQL